MKRKLILPILVLWLASMACSLFVPDKSKDTPPEEPTAVLQAEQQAPTEEIEPTATEEEKQPEPTATEEVIVEPTETEVVIVETPTEEPPSSYEYTFDRNTDDWSEPLFVTTQAVGEPKTKITIENGVLRFGIKDKETYVYKFLNFAIDGDVVVEVDYQNKGQINTGIAVICKANDAMTTWYEVRVTAMDGMANFYLYDKARRDEGKNPYLLLSKAHFDAKVAGPTKPNHIQVTCTDDQLIIDINNGKKVASQDLETRLDGNMVGLGGMSYDVLPVTLDIDTAVISSAE